MINVKFLNGWKKNFSTICLENYSFRNDSDDIVKIVEILKIFSLNNIKCQFNVMNKNDQFFNKIINIVNCKVEILYSGKKLFSKKPYYLIEVQVDEPSFYKIIQQAIFDEETLEFKGTCEDKVVVVEGVLFGDGGGAHSIHFNTCKYRVDEIKSKVNKLLA